ncbi:hypothetical protein [Alteromonas naphthalenivorans]|uniref:Uncharacterized protein n=1 Tax=Alteromonas naphthalenivorans TaxID=715451 RepID=F5ZBD2_ALTNA|nr:hypothetical protein [Alteromonas naphthalenivorans]AEF02725.1 hypothetical protein ambt_05940 [Alteromonas naphthalenivorans]
MKPLPDFRSATYTLSSENPFRLTSPRSQATFRIPQQSTTGETSESSNNIPPDITFEEALASFKTLYAQKKYQGFALIDLINAELQLITKSIFVSIFGALTAFALGGFCWILLNSCIGLAMHHAGMPALLIMVILLLVNSILSVVAFMHAQSAFRFINLKRLTTSMQSLTK